jgi:hypothetical protein
MLAVMLMPAAIAWSGPMKAAARQSTEPEFTVSLRVTANKQVINSDTVIPLRLGQSVQLNVEVVHKDGRSTDVTTDSRTQYISIAPWILSVSATGLVTATAELARQYQIQPSGQDRGVVMVTYGLAGDRDRGAAAVRFEVRGKTGETAEEVLAVTAPKTTLRVGETVQLRVTNRLRDRSIEDLTDPSTGTTYFTTDEFMLVPEPDGRVTAVGTRGKPRESAIIGVQNGALQGSISFDLLPVGPGPRLQVVADSAVLREGEQTQLHVYKPVPNGTRKDVTATWSGTKYLIFTGSGRVNFNVVRINDSGLASAPASLGRYNWRAVMVFVRNGDDIGWIELKIVPAKAK